MAPHVRALGAPRTDPWQVNLTMTATTGATPSAQPERPGRSDGVCSEFTVFTKIKPGHADALREDLVALADAAASENVFLGAHLERQFEFIKAEWVNDGNFIGYPGEQDPVAGHHGGTGSVTIPEKPVRCRLRNLPSFVVTRGGEYCFVPGLRALRWLAELED
ncbi:hypothetical protein ACGFZ9_10070 [Streptomyces mirabilis]|uniref:hypothetical protein n=1 Tax=Streptomyces mirabilis TaxID=68239 RepID=UPI0037136592